jgi:hypothetical protein
MGHYFIAQLPTIVDKTVVRVESGFCEHMDGVHKRECMIMFFTDGSILDVDSGSNAANIASKFECARLPSERDSSTKTTQSAHGIPRREVAVC